MQMLELWVTRIKIVVISWHGPTLKYMKKHELVYGLDRMTGNMKWCDICIKSKLNKASFSLVG